MSSAYNLTKDIYAFPIKEYLMNPKYYDEKKIHQPTKRKLLNIEGPINITNSNNNLHIVLKEQQHPR